MVIDQSRIEDVVLTEEHIAIRERVIVAPATGRFHSLPPEVFTSEGEWVEPGQAIGLIRTGSTDVEVISAFRGWLMGMLVIPGQPVRQNEALFWVRS